MNTPRKVPLYNLATIGRKSLSKETFKIKHPPQPKYFRASPEIGITTAHCGVQLLKQASSPISRIRGPSLLHQSVKLFFQIRFKALD